MVGATGFEPATTYTPCRCATRLRYAPTSRRSATNIGYLFVVQRYFTIKVALTVTEYKVLSSHSTSNYCKVTVHRCTALSTQEVTTSHELSAMSAKTVFHEHPLYGYRLEHYKAKRKPKLPCLLAKCSLLRGSVLLCEDE
jgi:hypothetical protein